MLALVVLLSETVVVASSHAPIAQESQIPMVTVTPRLSPAGSGFEPREVAQLERLLPPLHRSTGR